LQLSPGKGDFDLEWIRQDYEHRQLIREFFACLGMRVLENYRLRETSRSLKLITKSAEKYRAEINIARLSGAEREQKLGSLHVQLDTYQDQIKAYQDRLKSCQDQMKTYQDQLKAYETQMKEQEHAYQAKFETEQQHLLQREQILQDLNSKLLEIYSSTTWKMMQKLRPIRLWLIPAGSHREKFIQRGITWFLSRGSMDRKS
jgi:septal ring factor EnvC (AmiA/AmiB activator)